MQRAPERDFKKRGIEGLDIGDLCREVLEPLGIAAKRPRLISRKAAASPATGLAKVHAAEQAALVTEALTV